MRLVVWVGPDYAEADDDIKLNTAMMVHQTTHQSVESTRVVRSPKLIERMLILVVA